MHIEPSAIQGTLYYVDFITPDEILAPSEERGMMGHASADLPETCPSSIFYDVVASGNSGSAGFPGVGRLSSL